MEKQSEVELVTNSEALDRGIDTWNRPRTSEQLLGFIAHREAVLSEQSEDE